MNKTAYTKPELEIIAFEAEDVITTSSGSGFDGEDQIFRP